MDRKLSVAPQAILPSEPSFKERLRLGPGHEGAIWYHGSSEYQHPRHRHTELELNLVIEGTARYLIGDRSIEVSRRCALWLFPGQDHVLVDQSSDFRMWIVVFRPELVQRVIEHGGADRTLRLRNPKEEHCRVVAPEVARLLAQNCKLMLGAESAPLLNDGLTYILEVAWMAYAEASPRPRPSHVDPVVARVVRLLQDDMTLTGTDLASAVELSRSHLSRRFGEQMGVGLVTFRNQLRIEHFLHAVESGGHTLLHAALEAGFGSYGQFHRIFRETMGESPRDYLARRGSTRPGDAARR